MNLSLIFFVIVIVAANDYELLAQLQNYEFGKTIIATMQITLASEDASVDGVVNQLKAMQKATQNDLDDNSQSIKQSQESCNLRFNELQIVIENAQNKKSDNERTLPFKQEELNIITYQIKDKLDQQKRIQDRRNGAEFSRSEEKKDFQQKQQETLDFISGLKKAKAILSQLKSSFLQVGDVRAKLHKHLESLNKTSPYHGLVKILIAAAGDDNVPKIIQIIDELVESLQHLLSVDRSGDEQKEELYQLQKNRYNLELQTLNTNIASLQAEAEKQKQKLLEFQNDIESKEQLLTVKNQEYNDWKKTCDDDLRANQNLRQIKFNELNIINECIEIFTTRLNPQIKSYIQELEI
ncbi:unnamed protein product [Paramecium pentaurelia]|uniref:Trichocyst matrix protein n=1 Tax=Paramecium pentaurelia TaxID=43138 RepID=A0A8S1UBP7_9CILI|nr:unnamed protein product [Paramecium pentaurelia]